MAGRLGGRWVRAAALLACLVIAGCGGGGDGNFEAFDVAFSPDGSLIAAALEKGFAQAWNPQTGALRWSAP